jgi:hypothetical protein
MMPRDYLTADQLLQGGGGNACFHSNVPYSGKSPGKKNARIFFVKKTLCEPHNLQIFFDILWAAALSGG